MVSGQSGVHTAAVQQLVVLELKLELEPVLIQVLAMVGIVVLDPVLKPQAAVLEHAQASMKKIRCYHFKYPFFFQIISS